MKKIIGLLSIAGLLAVMACSNNKPAEVKKEIIVVPTRTIVVDPPQKTTTVTLDKNGVKVQTKKDN